MDRNTRVCFIVQRYGSEINGGAELLCKELAEHLRTVCDEITVLTTKAKDYVTWKNEYENDEEVINGIRVIRFTVTPARNNRTFNAINERFAAEGLPESEERTWVLEQGPQVPQLIDYLRSHKDDYDVFVFSTYLFYPTVFGIPEVAEKSICMPNAHDEPYLRMKIFENVFLKPRAFLYNTEEERKFVHRRFRNASIPSEIGGAGVDLPATVSPEAFKKKHGLDNFIVYVGRIDQAKNCNELFQYFQEYKKRNDSNLKLVLMGKATMRVPKGKDIVNLGFVSDTDKFNGIAAAQALVVPSLNESLSIVVLEAMSLRTSVLVNARCSVLKGHCTKSNGALYYNGYFEFEGMLNYLITHPDIAEQLKDNASRYVQENYRWDVIVHKLAKLMELVMREGA